MSTVLVVDDELDSRQAMCAYLEKFGHRVRCAPNGHEALAALSDGMPDLIVLDWMMPKMDGITFLEIIRSYLHWSALPVVLVTAHSGHHLERARALGVECTFLKGSYELADLVACVNRGGHADKPADA